MTAEFFPTDITALPEARSPGSVELRDGEAFDLLIAPVAKRLGDATVRMLGYDRSIPGPLLRVAQGAEVQVNVRNEGDLEATVHWHGLRLDNRYDGTAETQRPMPLGGTFSYRLAFLDPGLYWYHPHIRQDYGQEMGLYGNILVTPADPDYWPPAHRDLTLTLDDVLLEDGRIAPFRRAETNYSAMGRYGNVMLVNGETDPSLPARRGEVVRLYLTNTANSRVFEVTLPGARMKLVGGDSGRCEREEMVQSVRLAPSERAVVDVLFEAAGELRLEHRTPQRSYTLATFHIADDAVEPLDFARLRTNADMVAERARVQPYLERAPDRTLALVAEMDLGAPAPSAGETSAYVCPMHLEVRSHQAERCPLCGMKLLPASLVTAAADHRHQAGGGAGHGHAGGGIEWEDDMVAVNRLTTPANTRWKLVDRATGAAGAAIAWRFRVGDQVKIRLVNEMDSDHPMHHPFHIHGAGRFLILARDGVAEPNLVWKDTVLVPTGETVDILLDVTHPGRWMAHCHIAEHHESGMMLSFDVDP